MGHGKTRVCFADWGTGCKHKRGGNSPDAAINIRAGPHTFPTQTLDYMFEGRPYTITAKDCSSHGSFWSDDNGGQCTLDVTHELCDSSAGKWYTDANGGGCTIDPHSNLVLGSFANLETRALGNADGKTDIKGRVEDYEQVAMTNVFLTCLLALGVGMLLLMALKAIKRALGRRQDDKLAARVVLVGADVEGGYKDEKVDV